MCLSTAYLNNPIDDNIIAKYVSEIKVEGDRIKLIDVMGAGTEIKGHISFVDLTGGKGVITEEQ